MAGGLHRPKTYASAGKQRQPNTVVLKAIAGRLMKEASITDIRSQRARKKQATTAMQALNPEFEADLATNKAIERELSKIYLETSTEIIVDDPFAMEGIPELPPLKTDPNPEFNEFDLLTDEKVKRFADLIVKDKASPELAAMGVGIPPATMREYIDTGNGDLAAGHTWTRKAILASVALKASYAVIAASMAQIRKFPVGWQNHSTLLISLFPEFFSEKRATKKEVQQGARLEALTRQLGAASGAAGGSLPALPKNVS